MAKRKVNKCKCGLEKEVVWEGDGVLYPVFSCPDHGPNKRNEWKLWWDQYSDRWQEDKNWDNLADGLSCVVGFFCHKYMEFYEQPYIFSFANPNPYKDKDFVIARRILTMFSGKARVVKNYIEWVFAKRIRTPSYAIKSLGFFASQKFANEYLLAKSRGKKIRRRSPLPEKFLMWCKATCPEVFDRQELKTWNDLNGLVTHVKCYGLKDVEGKVVMEAVCRQMLPPGPEYRKMED